jgi:hypothetical protein
VDIGGYLSVVKTGSAGGPVMQEKEEFEGSGQSP